MAYLEGVLLIWEGPSYVVGVLQVPDVDVVDLVVVPLAGLFVQRVVDSMQRTSIHGPALHSTVGALQALIVSVDVPVRPPPWNCLRAATT